MQTYQPKQTKFPRLPYSEESGVPLLLTHLVQLDCSDMLLPEGSTVWKFQLAECLIKQVETRIYCYLVQLPDQDQYAISKFGYIWCDYDYQTFEGKFFRYIEEFEFKFFQIAPEFSIVLTYFKQLNFNPQERSKEEIQNILQLFRLQSQIQIIDAREIPAIDLTGVEPFEQFGFDLKFIEESISKTQTAFGREYERAFAKALHQILKDKPQHEQEKFLAGFASGLEANRKRNEFLQKHSMSIETVQHWQSNKDYIRAFFKKLRV